MKKIAALSFIIAAFAAAGFLTEAWSFGNAPGKRLGSGGRPRSLQRRLTEKIGAGEKYSASVCQDIKAKLTERADAGGCADAMLQGVNYSTIAERVFQACQVQFDDEELIVGFEMSLDLICQPA